jgi:RNA polymerase sigma-70 factor (ECF subfamily)
LTYRGQPPTRFKSWAYTIAINLARDTFKSARYRYEQASDFEDIEADEATFTFDERREVIEALAKLTPDHREVVVLRFYHDLKLEEIAEVTGAPLGTVKSRLFHALKQLKGFLAVKDSIHG